MKISEWNIEDINEPIQVIELGCENSEATNGLVSGLNQAISSSASDLFVVAENKAHLSEKILRGLKLLSRSESLEAVIQRNEQPLLIIKKSGFQKIGQFSSNDQGIVNGFIEQECLVRRISFIEIPQMKPKIEKRAKKTDFIPQQVSDESLSFQSGVAQFTFTPTLAETITKVEEIPEQIGDQALIAMAEEGIQKLHQQKPDEALVLFREVLPRKDELTDLHYAKAVAEAELGMYPDAMHSLQEILKREPQHMQAAQLLQQLFAATQQG